MKTYTAIKAEIARLEMQAEAMRKTEIAGVIARIKEAITAYGLTAPDLGLSAAARVAPPQRGKGRKEAAATVGTARYRDPKTGATWTGRGRPPAWLAAAGNRDRFLIGAPGAPSAADPASDEPAPKGGRKPRAAAKGGGAKSAVAPKPSGRIGKKAAARVKTPAVRSEPGAAPE